MKLITRADDAGSSLSANNAIFQCATQGFIRNISLMAPGAAIEDAAKQLSSLQHVDFGLHCTLNSEWQMPRWGPICEPQTVPALINADGNFTPTPNHLFERGVNEAMIEQCVLEIRAQLKRLRDVGFSICYIDEHMGVAWLPGLRPHLQVLAREENLIYWPDCPRLSLPDNSAQNFIGALSASSASTCLTILHPTFDDEETRSIQSDTFAPGQIARERNADRELSVNTEVLNWCRDNQIVFSRYSEAIENR